MINNKLNSVTYMLIGATIPCIIYLTVPKREPPPVEPEPIPKEIILNRAGEFFTRTVPRDWKLPPINCGLEPPTHHTWKCWALFGSTLIEANCDEVGCIPK